MNREHDEEPNELGPSLLGTKNYWDDCYKRELDNFASHGDEGEAWFGEDSAKRVTRWLEKNVDKTCTLLDVGCGNGQLLTMLWESGFLNLTGVDYCQGAVDMAAKVLASHDAGAVTLKVLDVTSVDDSFASYFDVIHDKGTYDAISLHADGPSMRKKYIEGVCQMLNKEGQHQFLVITSCNWTSEELKRHFEKEFEFVELLPTPKFQFGGKQGNTITSIIFKKKHSILENSS